jgi:2-keto-4-pentenoate hydratase/2-oxohepta-3-ene-1,7-dioic acid hydratase in catechol pathway
VPLCVVAFRRDRHPQEWLQDGDVMETEIEGIGTMRNRIVFENRE